MEYKDLKNNTAKDLIKMDKGLREELFQLRLKLKTQQLTNKHRVQEVRRDLARVQTKLSSLQKTEKDV